ncbi:syntaxin-7-like isoform X2 [Hydractinia symbiolongicarpus]|uniref:syntaxin-7-like isoform X2 n=1 Tax=Hydractinia symbiolongicarpus TaxID=13093 RepID=UPI00254D75E9|nr:syntaxin-7-like isoform X2 [Hydractinia symbiolongicarpus]
MSRGDFGSGQGYQSGYGVESGGFSSRNGDSEYIRLSNCVSNNIQLLTRKIAAIQQMVNQIGTSQDVPQLFDKLQNEQKESNRLVKETSTYLKQLSQLHTTSPTEVRQRKIQQDKLQENFSNVLHNFQKVQRLAAEKERASVQRARAKSMERGFQNYEHRDTSPMNHDRGPQMQVQAEAELSIDMIREREEALRRLESDIVDVNEIFKDLAIMVHEQGDVIDSIEANVDSAAVHVETANVQLEKAKHYQKASRKKMCCILVILLVVGIILGIVIWQTTK